MTDIKTIKPPKIIPNTNNPAVAMGLKLVEQQRKKKEREEKKKEKKEAKPRRAPVWAVDFDGTLSLGNHFPNIGKPNTRLIELLKMARLQGIRLILWSSREGNYLTEAVEWCKDLGLEFDAVNDNIPDMIEYVGGNPRKVVAHLFIDDRAFHFWGEEGEERLCKLLQEI